MGRRIDIEADDVPELLGKITKSGSFDSLNVRMRCGAIRGCAAPNAGSPRSPWPIPGLSSAWPLPVAAQAPDRRPAAWCQAQAAACRACASCRATTRRPFRHEPGLPPPHHRLRFARSAHNLGGAAAIGGGEDDVGAPHMFLRRATVGDDSLKPAAVCSRDGDDNSCSHAESLNCFGRFGNRPYESDH